MVEVVRLSFGGGGLDLVVDFVFSCQKEDAFLLLLLLFWGSGFRLVAFLRDCEGDTSTTNHTPQD
jgi:hypothetical protein